LLAVGWGCSSLAADATGEPSTGAQTPAVAAAQSALETHGWSPKSASQTDGTGPPACGSTTVVVAAGAWQIHFDRGTGELTVTGASLDGGTQGTAIRFAAPRVELAGTWHALGRVLACQGSTRAVEVTQDFGGHPVLALLSA